MKVMQFHIGREVCVCVYEGEGWIHLYGIPLLIPVNIKSTTHSNYISALTT